MKALAANVACAALAAAAALAGPAAAQESAWQAEAEAKTSREHLSGGRADWRSNQLDLLARSAARRAYYLSLRATERFEQRDNDAMVGTYQPLDGGWAAQVEATTSPTHHVLARHALLVQLERRIDGGWGVQAGFRRSAFEHSNTDLGIFTVERYFSSFRAAYSLYLGRPDGAGFGPSHRIQFGHYYSDRSFFGIAASNGRETENIFPSGVLTSQVRSVTLGGRHEFAPGWAATYEWLTHRQGDLYTRRGLGFGLRHAF